ncbi:MAG: GHKL domain-containing protein [Anaerolineales bacterium]|nr:GHKL domain-containing protein [Anaerolineales bacterium]
MNRRTSMDETIWLRGFRRRILNLLLFSVVILGTAGLVISIFQHIRLGRASLQLVYYSCGYVFALVLLFARRIPDRWRALGFLSVLYLFTVFTFITGWLGGGGRIFLITFIIQAAILLGPQSGVIAAGISLLTFIAFGVVYSQGWLVYRHAPVFADPTIITIEGIGFAMAVGLTSIALWFFKEGLAAATQAMREAQEAREMLADHADQLNEANRLLAERTSMLESANKELESFSYSVSHDLRAPLRAIDGYGKVLLQDHAGELDQDGRNVLDNILHAARRMGVIIDDLLKLSRLTRFELVPKTVSLSDLAQEVFASLQQNAPDRRVEVFIQPGIICEGDPNLLRLALENLLGNAWKFTSRQPRACIEFRAVEQDGEIVYSVQDNGVGFNMAYVNKIFDPFRRLHREDEYEGSGIGLAIVKRIITRHGGRIWVEADVNQGATFYFTLRCAP